MGISGFAPDPGEIRLSPWRPLESERGRPIANREKDSIASWLQLSLSFIRYGTVASEEGWAARGGSSVTGVQHWKQGLFGAPGSPRAPFGGPPGAAPTPASEVSGTLRQRIRFQYAKGIGISHGRQGIPSK